MAKKSSPSAASVASSATALADPPRPSYVAAPLDELEEKAVIDAICEQCSNASYSLLDQRNGSWQLLVFGSGQTVRIFASLNEGVEFVKDVGITNCRCLQLPEGVVR